MELGDSIKTIKGIGPKKAEAFARLGIYTLEDMIYTCPRIYEDRRNVVSISALEEDKNAVFMGTVEVILQNPVRGRGKRVTRVLVSDNTGSVEVVFFNGLHISKTMRVGDRYSFFGSPTVNNGRLQVLHPQYEKSDMMRTGIMPIYPLTKGISQREMRKIQRELMPLYGKIEDILTPELIARQNLCSLEYALENIHFPKNKKQQQEAKYRIVFDEFMTLEAGLQFAKKNGEIEGACAMCERNGVENEYIASLPYPLTNAQNRSVREIAADLEASKRMNRLLQGDVGSGKTAVAEIAIFKTVKSGFQAVMMAPTEILAHQHYEEFRESLGKHGMNVGFLAGSMKAAEKREVLAGLEKGSIDVLVGTHAIIQPEVEFNNLGLVVTDEQHRFGVNQRIKLKDKGVNPNVLVMTATPIPRTLAVVLYGDMDVSIIDELPPGRQAVITKCLSDERGRKRCYDFVSKQIEQGRQAYVVTPLIDESEAMNAKSAEEVYAELSKKFKRTAIIHGSMKQSEKDSIMAEFNEGNIDVLVATVVIEVGINVPNASVMVVENAERFGLAQLHQLRGRVGRGKYQSYCFLILESESETAIERGRIMEESSDGFFIAEEDMRLRGAGEIFGTRQHGLPDMKLADMVRHISVLNIAKGEASKILEEDPQLAKAENLPLKRRIKKLFGDDVTLNL